MIRPPVLRVLLVEDNEIDAKMTIRLLEGHELTEFVVHRASGLVEALVVAGDTELDCVLLDLSLPDSVGLASIDAFLAAAPDRPVVVLTGLEDPAVAVQALEHGAQDYLTKRRADAELVGRAVRHAVARSRTEAELRAAQELVGMMHDRERIARDLHDTVIQQLFAAGMSVQAIAGRVGSSELRHRLIAVVEEIDDGIRHLREAIFRLHTPPAHVGLVDEVNRIAEAETAALGFSPTVRVAVDIGYFESEIRQSILSTVREALANVAKHADASAVQIDVTSTDGDLVVTVVDNGVGLGAPVLAAGPLAGRGLANMADRAAELAGDFTVNPGPGGGTEVVWRVPLDQPARDEG